MANMIQRRKPNGVMTRVYTPSKRVSPEHARGWFARMHLVIDGAMEPELQPQSVEIQHTENLDAVRPTHNLPTAVEPNWFQEHENRKEEAEERRRLLYGKRI